MTTIKNIGLSVEPPSVPCDDKRCPFHGTLNVKKRTFSGLIVSDKMSKSVTVEWERRIYLPKYERYGKRKTKIKAHLPPCINAKLGDRVMIAQTRALSKTISFVVIKKY